MKRKENKNLWPVKDEMMTDTSLVNLKIKITTARKVLEQVWEKSGETNESVIAAADRFDRLLNEYRRMVGKGL